MHFLFFRLPFRWALAVVPYALGQCISLAEEPRSTSDRLLCWPQADAVGSSSTRAASSPVSKNWTKVASADYARAQRQVHDFDQDGDHRLDQAELAQVDERRRVALLRRYDRDRDGQLDSEELAYVTDTSDPQPEPELEPDAEPSSIPPGRWLVARQQAQAAPRPSPPAAVFGVVPGLTVHSHKRIGDFRCESRCSCSQAGLYSIRIH